MELKNPSTLFQLIKAMDRGEKRFFSLFCNRQDNKAGKLYIKLFKYIDAQKNYDEFGLKKKFKNYGTQFDLTKWYLYKLILESLVQYYTKDHLSLYDQLLKVKILHEKGLSDPALKLIYRIRKLAEEQNNFFVAIETINMERAFLLISADITAKSLSVLEKQQRQYIILYNEIELYKQLSDKIYFFRQRYYRMYRDDIKKENNFKKIVHSTLFNNTNKPRSTMSKWLLFCARARYYVTLNDVKKGNKEYFASIKILDYNSEFKKNHPNCVAISLKGYINSCITLKKFDLALQKLAELKIFCSLYSSIEIEMALLSCQITEIDIYLYTDRKNEAILLIKEIEEKIKKEEMLDNHNRLVFYVNASVTYLFFCEYQKSLHWLNKVLNFEFAEKKFPTIYSIARVIQLLNLTELKEYDLLFYRLKSFHRFLGKQNSIYRYQEIFMDFIRRILKGEYNKGNLLVLYKDVKGSLVKALKDPEEAQACYFDFIGWFESKIENIPYTTWVKMNLKTNQK